MSVKGEEFPLLPVVVGAVVGVLGLAVLIVLCLVIIVCWLAPPLTTPTHVLAMCCCYSCRRNKSRQFGMEPRPLQNMELEKKREKRDYVNDTELGENPPPLYTAVPGKGSTLAFIVWLHFVVF